jgi:hypothetical protein
LKDGLYIWSTGLGPITSKFGKVIICFETGGVNVNGLFLKLTSVFFLNINHSYYLTKTKYKYPFGKYHDITNDNNLVNVSKLPTLNMCITYYNNFVDPDPPIIKEAIVENF